tara:strand:+ start:139 stop:426 length:288 start_codon:yes stop_codon:yes gene_type:complete
MMGVERRLDMTGMFTLSNQALESCSRIVLILTLSSGRRIVEILKKNPQKDPESYDEGTYSPLPPSPSFDPCYFYTFPSSSPILPHSKNEEYKILF